METVEEAGIQQQVIALQMQADIRDAEAALYRYLMEGRASGMGPAGLLNR